MVQQIADAAGRTRGRDQRQPVLLCTISQHGTTGEWSAEGPDGQALTVKTGMAGLEVYTAPEAEGDQADPEIVGAAPPGAESFDALRKRIASRPAYDRPTSQQQASQMRDWQAYLDQVYRPK
jgi:hypothetical protein